MKKKILIFAIPILIFVIIFSSLLALNIPHIKYGYDSITDTYFVEEVFGNAKSYEIREEYNNKKVTTSIGKWAKEINRQTPKVDKHMKIASESL